MFPKCNLESNDIHNKLHIEYILLNKDKQFNGKLLNDKIETRDRQSIGF